MHPAPPDDSAGCFRIPIRVHDDVPVRDEHQTQGTHGHFARRCFQDFLRRDVQVHRFEIDVGELLYEPAYGESSPAQTGFQDVGIGHASIESPKGGIGDVLLGKDARDHCCSQIQIGLSRGCDVGTQPGRLPIAQGSHYRQAFGQTALLCGLCRYCAEHCSRKKSLRELIDSESQGRKQIAGPAVVDHIENPHSVDTSPACLELARHLENQESMNIEILVGFLENSRFVLAQPDNLGNGRRRGQRLAGSLMEFVCSIIGIDVVQFDPGALIQPYNAIAQRGSLFVHSNEGLSLVGHTYCSQTGGIDSGSCVSQSGGGSFPPVFCMLLPPGRVRVEKRELTSALGK